MYSDVASFTFILFYFFLIDLRCVCVCVGRGAFMGATSETATTYVPWSNRWVCAAKRLLLLYERTTERERLRSAPAASAAAILMRPHHTCMNRIYSRDRIHLRFFLHVAPFHPLPSSCWLAAIYLHHTHAYMKSSSDSADCSITLFSRSFVRSNDLHARAYDTPHTHKISVSDTDGHVANKSMYSRMQSHKDAHNAGRSISTTSTVHT